MNRILILICFFISTISYLSAFSFDCDPRGVISNSIDACSGEYREVEEDLVVPAPEPLTLSRLYREGKWLFYPHAALYQVVSDSQMTVYAFEPNGTSLTYQGSEEAIALLKVPKGVSNTRGLISGKTNLKNNTIAVTSNFITITAADGTKRVYEKSSSFQLGQLCDSADDLEAFSNGNTLQAWHLIREILPSGNQRVYSYDDAGRLSKCEAQNQKSTKSFGWISFTYADSRVMALTSNQAFATYTYQLSRLIYATRTTKPDVAYAYTQGRLLRKDLPEGRFMQLSYDNSGRVKTFTTGGMNGSYYNVDYAPQETTVTDPVGNTTIYRFRSSLLVAKENYQNSSLYQLERLTWGSGSTSHELQGSILYDEAQVAQSAMRYTYDVCGNVMKEEQFIESIELDSKMLANKAKEIQAVQYEFSQDAFHNITKQIEANGDVLELQYKPNTNLCIERHFTAKGGISRRGVSFYNDDASLVIESIDENGKGRAWTYSPKSFVLGKGDEEIIEEKWVDFTAKKTMLIKKVRTLFNAQGNPYKKEVFGSDGLLATTELFEYDARGRCISNTNPLGVTVTSSYDVNNNRSRISHQSTRETVCFDYDLDDRLVTTTQQFQDRKSVKSRTEYDAYGRCIATIDRYGNRIDYIFDPTGHLVCMKKPAVVAANGSSQRYETSFERDFTPSRLVLSDHAAIDMADIFSPYRESGTTCDTLWRPIRVQKMVDNKVAIFECKKYDAIGQVVQEWIEQPDGTIILEKFHEYDGFGNIVKVTTASGVEVRKFIEGDRVELITNPQGRSIVIEYDDTQTNQLGQFVLTKRVIEPSGRVVQVQYDSLEREAMRLCFDAGNTLLSKKEYFYDMKDHITAMVDSLCGPTGIITGQVRTEYLYDGEGELVKVKQAAGTPLERVMELKDPADAVSEVAPYVVRCEKDNLGRVTKLLLPDHSFIQYCYKGLFQSAVVRYSATGQELYRHEFTEYSKQGLAAKENVIGKGGVKTTTYNAMGQVSQITQPEFTQTVLEWDADGQPAIVEKNGIQMVLQFDGLGRLIREKSSRNIALQYDSQGNILKFGVRKFNYDILNQIQRENGTFYSYNTYGDLAEIKNSNTLKKFSYDPSYRLSAYIEKDSTVTFGYDAFDNRVRRRVGDTVQYYLYVDDTEIGAVDSKGCIVELKVPQSIIDGEVTGCVAIELKDGKVYRPTVDLFGNIAALHDAKTNKLVESYEYTGFGQEQIFNAAQERFDDSPVGNAWRFQAARKDPLTGFLWWCGRDYCTDTGRFINPDRNALIQGINPFHFPDNNPFQIMEVELET